AGARPAPAGASGRAPAGARARGAGGSRRYFSSLSVRVGRRAVLVALPESIFVVAAPLVSSSAQPQSVPALIAASTLAVTGIANDVFVDGTKLAVAVEPIVRPATPFQVRVDELQLE